MRPNRWAPRTFCAGISCLLAVLFEFSMPSPGSGASVVKLSAEGLPTSDVAYPADPLNIWDPAPVEVASDGLRFVYRHDVVVDEAFDLYSASRAGGQPIRLSAALPAGSSIGQFAISPDGAHVYYTSDQESPGTVALYGVPIVGPPEASVRLSPPFGPERMVTSFYLAPDGTRLVFPVSKVPGSCGDYCGDLYSVPVEGPAEAAVQLNPSGVSMQLSVPWLKLAPDSSRVVFIGLDDVTQEIALFSVPVAGPPAALVRLDPVGAGQPHSIAVTPDSSRVVFRSGLSSYPSTDVYSVPVEGPAEAAVRLNEPPPAVNSSLAGPVISPDSSTVLYRVSSPYTPANRSRLYSVPIAGPSSASVQLNPPPAGLGAVSAGGVVTPDSSRVVFTGTLDLDLTNHLYSVPIHGPSSSAIRISVDLPPGRDVTSWTAVTPDGGYVLYGADSVVAGSSQVYRAPVEGPVSANLPLSPTPASGGTVEYERVSPDGRTVFFWGDFATPGVEELFAVPFDGPADAVERVNAPLVAGGNVYTEISWTPDGRSLAYRADQEVDGKVELYLAAVPLFVDGFESGDSGRWSSTTP